MSNKIDQIVNELKGLTLIEASELVSKIEETFGVNASLNIGGQMMIQTPDLIEEIEEKTEFSVLLEEVPKDKKIPVLKIVRHLTGLGLKEAKQLVDSAPKQIQENLTKEAAESIKMQFEEVGAKVSLV